MKEYKTLRELPGIPVGTIFNENQEIRIGFHMKPGSTEGTGWFEEVSESPTKKYKEALRQGKRVFIFQVGNGNGLVGQMIDINDINDSRIPTHGKIQEYFAEHGSYFIEGEDIPVKPSEAQLAAVMKSYNIYGELTGECRIPKVGEYFVGGGTASSLIRCDYPENLPKDFSRKRWIFKKFEMYANIEGTPIYIHKGFVKIGSTTIRNSVIKDLCESLKY